MTNTMITPRVTNVRILPLASGAPLGVGGVVIAKLFARVDYTI